LCKLSFVVLLVYFCKLIVCYIFSLSCIQTKSEVKLHFLVDILKCIDIVSQSLSKFVTILQHKLDSFEKKICLWYSILIMKIVHKVH